MIPTVLAVLELAGKELMLAKSYLVDRDIAVADVKIDLAISAFRTVIALQTELTDIRRPVEDEDVADLVKELARYAESALSSTNRDFYKLAHDTIRRLTQELAEAKAHVTHLRNMFTSALPNLETLQVACAKADKKRWTEGELAAANAYGAFMSGLLADGEAAKWHNDFQSGTLKKLGEAEASLASANALLVDFASNAIDCAQIIDAYKSEDPGWSKWDQSVRDRISDAVRRFNARMKEAG